MHTKTKLLKKLSNLLKQVKNKTYASNISSKTDWIVMKKDFMSRNQINLSQWKDFHWFYLFWILGSVASAVIPTLLVVMTNGFDWSSLIQDGECYLFLFGITINVSE